MRAATSPLQFATLALWGRRVQRAHVGSVHLDRLYRCLIDVEVRRDRCEAAEARGLCFRLELLHKNMSARARARVLSVG